MLNNRVFDGVSARILVKTRRCQKKLWQYDPDTYLHCQKVAQVSYFLSHLLRLPSDAAQYVYLGALIHDLGKTAIPKIVLHKTGALTPEERAMMQRHPSLGREIALSIMKNVPETEKRVVLDIVEFHHERVDGKGYPYGMSGTEIPLAARIVAVADALDAMVSYRSYRSKPKNVKQALEELKHNSGYQFDRKVVGKLVEFFTTY
ncbi:MAG: HD domain-containing protein [Syntrophothermus sp.]|uniref:HD-GYP domain-containing protein n=1 Tax=Syntrophothermus sp. TaxID=2736299 RepID=UPI0025805161|nr:HD domain-containing phosphohydrolase [Syntrophothermus sp.]NSW84180.1 HD domain-containing protein [Syntrophothermus sp.]